MCKINMKKLFLSILFILGLSGFANKKTEEFVSPSGEFSVYATVNGTDKTKPNYADVVLHLLDNKGQEIQVVVSGVGDAHKWALGWMSNQDIVILYSIDIGDLAFKIENSKLVELSVLTEQMKKRAYELRKQKYGS